jgi:hypothetical protein
MLGWVWHGAIVDRDRVAFARERADSCTAGPVDV